MTNETATTMPYHMAIEGERIRLYEEHVRPQTLRSAIKRVKAIARDLTVLEGLGDREAVSGATVMLRDALLDVMAVPARNFAEHEQKHAVVNRHFETVTDEAPWLIEAMLGVAVRIEWDAIDISPAQEQHLRAAMPRSRIEG